MTLEGAPALANLARDHLGGLGHAARVRVVVGPFDETLAGVCAAHGPFDLVFVDGHHEREAALRYVAAVRPHLAPGAVVVLDDVEPGRPVRGAYRHLRAEGLPGVWLGKWGVLTLPSETPAVPIRRNREPRPRWRVPRSVPARLRGSPIPPCRSAPSAARPALHADSPDRRRARRLLP